LTTGSCRSKRDGTSPPASPEPGWSSFRARTHAFFSDPDPVVDQVEEFVTGTSVYDEPDRVLATMLFTDIVGSTRTAADVGDRRWHELLDAHDAVVRRQLDRFRGRSVKQTGDGHLAVFDGPARAIRCGLAIRDGVRPLGLNVRVGIHTGETSPGSRWSPPPG
jgi:class 3 adenylate cyclase